MSFPVKCSSFFLRVETTVCLENDEKSKHLVKEQGALFRTSPPRACCTVLKLQNGLNWNFYEQEPGGCRNFTSNDNEKLYQVKREFGFKEEEIRDPLFLSKLCQ